jgi:hypothetical protein
MYFDCCFAQQYCEVFSYTLNLYDAAYCDCPPVSPQSPHPLIPFPLGSFERALAQTASENAAAAAAAADELRDVTEAAARSETRLRAKIDELRAALGCVIRCQSEENRWQGAQRWQVGQ